MNKMTEQDRQKQIQGNIEALKQLIDWFNWGSGGLSESQRKEIKKIIEGF
ncbi:MAG: hypothetical protein LBL60_01345 [Mycoplasmataceae bacterium]|jgi:hypothetical protein|nr:hypothetical protein [Mycoplasmataceae bacterium]